MATSGSRRGQQVSKTRCIERVVRKKRQNYTEMSERLGASFVPLVFSAFGYIPDTALDFLSFVSVTGNELHLNSWPTGPRGLRAL